MKLGRRTARRRTMQICPLRGRMAERKEADLELAWSGAREEGKLPLNVEGKKKKGCE